MTTKEEWVNVQRRTKSLYIIMMDILYNRYNALSEARIHLSHEFFGAAFLKRTWASSVFDLEMADKTVACCSGPMVEEIGKCA